MSELRKAALKILEMYLDGVDYDHAGLWNPEMQLEVVNLRAALNEPDGWISVDERLPDGASWQLCYFPTTGNYIVCYFNPNDGLDSFFVDGLEVWPTHWMPLPAPPEQS